MKTRFLCLVSLFLSKFIVGENISRDSISGFKLIIEVQVATKFILSATISVLLFSSKYLRVIFKVGLGKKFKLIFLSNVRLILKSFLNRSSIKVAISFYQQKRYNSDKY